MNWSWKLSSTDDTWSAYAASWLGSRVIPAAVDASVNECVVCWACVVSRLIPEAAAAYTARPPRLSGSTIASRVARRDVRGAGAAGFGAGSGRGATGAGRSYAGGSSARCFGAGGSGARCSGAGPSGVRCSGTHGNDLGRTC
ncbi:MAG: hypothetical protein JWO46_2533 [Nocardioidaceae bacterium]|nr:hypothetical protein [Nocardioidaceae bacterium]